VKVLIDIGHPAHVHFFCQPLKLLRNNGHDVFITSRKKEIATDLLDKLGIEHVILSTMGSKGSLSLFKELITRDLKLRRVVKQYRPDIMAAIGGIFISHVGRLTGVPSLVFYDTENATLQNALTYPLASCVIVPRCYESWVPKRHHRRYAGYHELSYLHPDYFTPCREIALANGLAKSGDTFLLRTVSWQASHDIGEHGWNYALLEQIVNKLKNRGTVLISSEMTLPDDFRKYNYLGDPARIHHVMAFCRGYVGESATMASECAVLGVPSVYIAETGRGYTNEQERKYDLVRNVLELEWTNVEQALDWLFSLDADQISRNRKRLLDDTIDVAKFVVDCIQSYPELARQN
jgi:predicted glycosyltransferase